MRRLAVLLVVLLAAPVARADDDVAPLRAGMQAEGYATVCLERWHATLVRKLRNAAVGAGKGAMAQIAAEKEALFQGQAWCFTDFVAFTPAEHADVIDGVRTWVQVADPDGPEACPAHLSASHCRWTVETHRFVEATVEHPDVLPEAVVYVSTARPLAAGKP